MSFQSVERYAFDRVFRVIEPAIADADAALDREVLRAELQAQAAAHETALAIARADAFEAGLTHARGEQNAALLCAVDALHGAIDALEARFDDAVERVVAEATDVALAAAHMLAGRALSLDPAALIDEGIGRVLEQIVRGTELHVRVHPDLVEPVQARIAARRTTDRRQLNLAVMPDATLTPGDALINWDHGGLLLDAQARRAAVESELAPLLALIAPAPSDIAAE